MYPSEREIKTLIHYFNEVVFSDYSLERVASSWEVYNKWYSSLDDKDISCSGGATKIVFDEVLENWVVKINKIPNDDNYTSEDYCFVEAENYKKAKQCSLEEFFAETYVVNEISETTVIVQRKADVNEGETIASSAFFDSARDFYIPYNDEETSEERMYNISNEADELTDSERLFAIFGNSLRIQQLIDFIDENQINDLHEGNYGVINDCIVIVDFSGF